MSPTVQRRLGLVSAAALVVASMMGSGVFTTSGFALADLGDRKVVLILPIGSYEKRWIMKNQHINPDDAVRAHKILKSRQSMGIHYATFLEHPEQTIDAHEKDLAIALKKHGVRSERFWVLGFGEGCEVSP